MTQWTRSDALQAETTEAGLEGVPVDLAHAIAQVESGHNPYAQGDWIGGQPTSFGDYQLHRGGELGSLTPAQAFDPYTNAKIALHELASVIQSHPGVHDPGTLAALAQRPGDPAGYAMQVDRAMQVAPAGTSSNGVQNVQLASFGSGGAGGALVWTWDHTGGWVLHQIGGAASSVGGAIAAPFVAIYNLFRGVWDFFTSAKTWIRIGLFVGGGILLLLGLRSLVGGSSSEPMPIPVPV